MLEYVTIDNIEEDLYTWTFTVIQSSNQLQKLA